MVASLPADNSPLVGMLIRQQVRFWYEMAAIELQPVARFDWRARSGSCPRAWSTRSQAMHAEISRVDSWPRLACGSC